MIHIPFLKGKRVAVFGLGIAGKSAVKALIESGAIVFASDDNESSCEWIKEQYGAKVTVGDIHIFDWPTMEYLVLSPGIPLTHPQPHAVVHLAHEADCPIICDTELLYLCHPDIPIIAITGTNGKSTTTSLIHHILIEAGFHSQIGGNFGVPCLDLEPPKASGRSVFVIEMSSYQLDLVDAFRARVSVLLNITPDHLDRHGGMAGYIQAKGHLFDRQKMEDFAVIGVDDDHCQTIYQRLVSEQSIGTIIPISSHHKLDDGVSVIGGLVFDHNEYVVSVGQTVQLPGNHNAQNMAAAFAAVKCLGVSEEIFIAAIESFVGLEHRMQLVKTKHGVVFYNDSKATNADASAKALTVSDHIYWIVGGVAKDGGISGLSSYFRHIAHAYLIGEASAEFANELQAYGVNFTLCQTMDVAVQKAAEDAFSSNASDAVVLLSPACASFDQFDNFAQRGLAFCDYVNGLS